MYDSPRRIDEQAVRAEQSGAVAPTCLAWGTSRAALPGFAVLPVGTGAGTCLPRHPAQVQRFAPSCSRQMVHVLVHLPTARL